MQSAISRRSGCYPRTLLLNQTRSRVSLDLTPRTANLRSRKFAKASKCNLAATSVASETISPNNIPDEIQNSVAVLSVENNDLATKCYVFGISHVSKRSCDQVAELIKAVRPEIVSLELSKDRVGLLVDRERQDSQTWQTRSISIMGSTFSDDWPSKKDVLSLIRTTKGIPVQIQDIESDVLRLLSTGLFSRGRPTFTRAQETEAPAFGVKFRGGELEVQTVPPLGSVDFEMQDRNLPPIIQVTIRVDSSLKEYSLDQEKLNTMAQDALEMSKEGKASLSCYLSLRRSILDYTVSQGASDAVAIFRGEDRGDTEITVRARISTDAPLVTGFEEGAEGGYGWGIEPFRPANRPFKLSEKLMIPSKALQALTGNEDNEHQDQIDTDSEKALLQQLGEKTVSWREWNEDETPNIDEKDDRKGVADYFGTAVTTLYGKFQGDAGRKVGVDPGAAWRAALKASVENSVKQIQLIDIPEEISQKKIAQSIFAGMGIRFALATAFLASTVALAMQPWCPGLVADNAALTAFLGCSAFLWPVIGPYAEIAWLSAKSAEEIEESVRVKVPIQSDLDTTLKLFGEDALLDWPGAMDPVIHQRDQYMARNLFMSAKGLSNGAPAYIADIQNDRVVCRLLMPENGPSKASPIGMGDGVYEPGFDDDAIKNGALRELSIVAVVGSAHVRGICKEWERLTNNETPPSLDEFLFNDN